MSQGKAYEGACVAQPGSSLKPRPSTLPFDLPTTEPRTQPDLWEKLFALLKPGRKTTSLDRKLSRNFVPASPLPWTLKRLGHCLRGSDAFAGPMGCNAIDENNVEVPHQCFSNQSGHYGVPDILCCDGATRNMEIACVCLPDRDNDGEPDRCCTYGYRCLRPDPRGGVSCDRNNDGDFDDVGEHIDENSGCPSCSAQP